MGEKRNSWGNQLVEKPEVTGVKFPHERYLTFSSFSPSRWVCFVNGMQWPFCSQFIVLRKYNHTQAWVRHSHACLRGTGLRETRMNYPTRAMTVLPHSNQFLPPCTRPYNKQKHSIPGVLKHHVTRSRVSLHLIRIVLHWGFSDFSLPHGCFADFCRLRWSGLGV